MDQRGVLIKRYESSRAKMLAHLDVIDKNRKIYPLWTVREILAHLSGWDDAVIGFVQALTSGGIPGTPALRGMDVYNAETVATRDGLSYEQIYREYIQTRKTLLDMIRAMPEEKVTQKLTLPWGGEGTLVDLVDLFEPHETTHAEDVRKIIEDSHDVRAFNREAWDRQVHSGQNPWTVPVNPDVISRARKGEWSVLLTEQKSVPKHWFPPMQGLKILGLACGGGQQGPIFAAAGAEVTIFDNSPAQLSRDREVADRDGLNIHTVEGDMRDLSVFVDESFDLIFHPVSNLFIHEIRPVWKEAFRVLRHGGVMLSGFMQPQVYIFNFEELDKGNMIVENKIPYSDIEVYGLERLKAEDRPAEFGHSFTDQLTGQMDAGFHLVDMYEDYHSGMKLSEYLPTYMATRAWKP